MKLTYTNSRGESIELGNEKPYLLITADGVGAVDTDVQMQKAPFQDGRTHIDTLLEPRSISISIMALSENINATRAELARVLNPKLAGKLRYEYGSQIKEADVQVEHGPDFVTGRSNQGPTYQRAIINMVCPSPFWEDIMESTTQIAIGGGLIFPMNFPLTFATVAEAAEINNGGDVETPVRIIVYGPATNVTVENETVDKKITIDKELAEGERLEIVTTFGSKKVELIKADDTRENAFHYIDLESEFWNLAVGENIVRLSGDVDEDAVMRIYWTNRFVGV